MSKRLCKHNANVCVFNDGSVVMQKVAVTGLNEMENLIQGDCIKSFLLSVKLIKVEAEKQALVRHS